VCSAGCVLGVVGEGREQRFVLVTAVVSGLCGALGSEGKIILKLI
jgi:hypothetical protein